MDPAHFDVLLTPTIAHDGLMRFGRFFRCYRFRRASAGIPFPARLIYHCGYNLAFMHAPMCFDRRIVHLSVALHDSWGTCYIPQVLSL